VFYSVGCSHGISLNFADDFDARTDGLANSVTDSVAIKLPIQS